MTITPITEAREAELLDLIATGKPYRNALISESRWTAITDYFEDHPEDSREMEFHGEYHDAVQRTSGQRQRAAECLKIEARWSRELAGADRPAAVDPEQLDAAEHRAELLADARAEADVDEDARADSYERGMGW